MRSSLVAPILLLALAQAVAAAEFTAENASFVGADLVGLPFSLGGDLVLEIDEGRGLIRDYADPASPAWVGALSFNTGLIERGVYREGLFIGLHNDLFRGATLFDLADPARPAVLSSSFAPYHFTSAVLRAHLLYLTTDGPADRLRPHQPLAALTGLAAGPRRLRGPSLALAVRRPALPGGRR